MSPDVDLTDATLVDATSGPARIGVVGAGPWGRNHVRTLAQLGWLAGVVDASEVTRAQIAATHPDVTVTDSVSELIDAGVHAFVVATPAPTHAEVAGGLLERGCHVLVEKPFAMTTLDARALVDAATRNQVTVMAGHLLLYQAAVPWLRQFLSTGALGEVHAIHLVRRNLGRVRDVENVLWSLGVHDIALLLWLLGERPHHVSATGHRARGTEREDDVHLHLQFPSGRQAHLHTSWLWPTRERGFTITAERGFITYDEATQTLTAHRRHIDHNGNNVDGESQVLFHGGGEPLQRELEDFRTCFAKGEEPRANGHHATEVVNVLERATYEIEQGVMIG